METKPMSRTLLATITAIVGAILAAFTAWQVHPDCPPCPVCPAKDSTTFVTPRDTIPADTATFVPADGV